MSSMFRVAVAAAALALTIPAASASATGDEGPGGRKASPAAASASMAAFGSAIAVGDGEVFVGEARTLFRPGAVYVFRKGGSGWSQATTVVAPASEVADGFGSAIAYDNGTLFVGAGQKLYTYRKVGTTWQHVSTLESSAAGTGAQFGSAMSASGDWLLVGKQPAGFGRAGQGPAPSGAVYAFRRGANGQYAYHSTIARTDSAAAGNALGAAVAVNGNVALIGATGERMRAGLVHEYVFENNAWTFKRSLAPFGGNNNAAFGARIAMHNNYAAVTASGEGGGYGAVYLFRKAPTSGPGGQARPAGDSSWVEVSRLTSPTGRRMESFGFAVALDAREVWVGAPGASGTGATYIFKRDSAGLSLGGSVLPPGDASSGSAIGAAIALRGNLAAVGAIGVGSGAGGVLIFERDNAGNWNRSPMLRVPLDELTAMTGNETQCQNGRVGPFECSNSSLMSFIPPSKMTHDGHYIEMNDIWGWTDPQTGKEWALVGRRDGITYVDMSDPLNPVPVADMPMTPGHTPQSWRDMKVYKDHAYVVADNQLQHGMQVFDLKRLRTLKPVNGLPVRVEPDMTYREIGAAHNIVINEESGFAYSVGTSGPNSCGGGLHMIDIREPKNPKFAGCFAATGTGRTGTGYSHDAQCVNYKGPDTRYAGREICIGSNETAISIADVTDKKNPKALSHASYPNVAYAHQGWFTDDHKYFYLDDEIDELQYAQAVPRTRTLVWDLTDLENPRLAKEHLGEATSSDHNLYVKGNQVYQANYMSGLRILDIEDRENPKEVSFFDTDPYRATQPGYSGAWSVYPYFKSGAIIVNSIEQGLFIVKQTPRTVF